MIVKQGRSLIRAPRVRAEAVAEGKCIRRVGGVQVGVAPEDPGRETAMRTRGEAAALKVSSRLLLIEGQFTGLLCGHGGQGRKKTDSRREDGAKRLLEEVVRVVLTEVFAETDNAERFIRNSCDGLLLFGV